MDNDIHQQLLQLPHVVGVGLGYKEIGGVSSEENCLKVLVNKKLPPDQLSVHQLIPKNIDNVLTDVIEVGNLTVHELEPLDLEAYAVSRTSRIRPVSPGVSIAHYRVTAGTLGAVVYDITSGNPLLLSNNHVLANSSSTGRGSNARIGDPILQPGPLDGGSSSGNVIATLKRYIPLSSTNQVDCAVAEPLSPELITPYILDVGLVSGVTAPALQQQLKKSGRTTGLTSGLVQAVNVTANINYGRGRLLRFENQILTTRMSAPGDSGSLVLDLSNKAVGLLFAGSDTVTLLNPIQLVLDKLEVRF
jgi:hypothetical protein